MLTVGEIAGMFEMDIAAPLRRKYSWKSGRLDITKQLFSDCRGPKWRAKGWGLKCRQDFC
jgi:hypothetical protein